MHRDRRSEDDASLMSEVTFHVSAADGQKHSEMLQIVIMMIIIKSC